MRLPDHSTCPECGSTGANIDGGIVTCRDCGTPRLVGPGDDPRTDTVALLRKITSDINAAAVQDAAAFELARRELEDDAIDALHELAHRGRDWGNVGEVIAESEAWWAFSMLVERAYETLPDQIPDA